MKAVGTRRKSRELALQMLFQADMGKQDAAVVRRTFWEGRGEVSSQVGGLQKTCFVSPSTAPRKLTA